MTADDFRIATGIPLFTESNCYCAHPPGFELELIEECVWSANDGSDETAYVAIVRAGGWFYRVEGSHDNTGWDCHASASVTGPFRAAAVFDELVISRQQIGWDELGFERAKGRWVA